jgi:hypothetical protein
MPQVDFSQFHYYPALQCSDGEHIGYQNLPNDDKDRLVPIFELSQRSKALDLQPSIDLIRATTKHRPFIFDLCREPLPAPTLPKNPKDPDAALERFQVAVKIQTAYNAALAKFLDPSDGFGYWRSVVRTFENAVPTIQFKDAASHSRQILRQAALLSRDGNSIAIRVTQKDDPHIFSIIAQIISILESPDRLLIIIDAGYARQNVSKGASFALNSIAQILNSIDLLEAPLLRAVCMSSSFPKTDHDGILEIDNRDWALWKEAREAFPFMFGDYGATYRHRRTAFTPFDWRAVVVLPFEEAWLAYRYANAKDKKGWVVGAQEVKNDARFLKAPKIWGVGVIQQASINDITDIDSPKAWYGAKVNIHLHQQINFARNNFLNYEDDDDEPE